ncbi:hypothetical protein G7045_00475 [Acidovorax sp. HDW3]|uniref:hypothetical protein n=1 Tax=Acidovorax sp. HDW3 TaxID=2714923 RepID=UPI001408B9FC|nr:hypothetical protein [Acidovorax sp. HDW3]QIL42850.1 hypothetical protein G7045_00475 [Acidovorax sp. HDW3]
MGIALALVLPKTYETSVYLEPPLVTQYGSVNEGRTSLTGLKWVTGDELYTQFLAQLNSDAGRYEFFEKTYLPSLDTQPEGALDKNALYAARIKKLIDVKEPVPKKGRQLYSVTIQAPTGELAVQWMDAYLTQVQDAARARWAGEAQKVIDATIKNTEKDIAEKLALAKKLREDREIRLGEALRVAKSVGQQTPQLTVGQLPKQDSVTSFADGSGLYARGTRSLGAEIDVLRAREDETAFVDGLREAQAKLVALQGQNLSAPIGMYRIDGQLLEPAKPISPKKSLLTVLGLLLGLFSGIGVAFAKKALAQKSGRTGAA